MAALVISIFLNSSNESVGSSIPRVILFGSIPTEIPVVPADLPVVPEVGMAVLISHVGVLELDTHSSSKSDTELPERHISSAPHDVMVARWRSRVASQPFSPSGSLSPTTSTSEFPTAPILPAPPAIVAPSTDIISPIDAPPGDFDRKEVDWTLTFSSLGIEGILHELPPLLIHLRHRDSFIHHLLGLYGGSEAYRRWRFALLSTIYLPTTSESLARDSSSESSAGPSHKRCRSPAATVPLPIPAPGALVPTRSNLLPPHKRFRDSYSSRDSIEEDVEADVLVDIEVDATVVETAAVMDVEVGIGIEVDVGVDMEYEAESSARGIVEIGMDRVIEPVVADDITEPASKDYPDLDSDDGSRRGYAVGIGCGHIMSITRSGMTSEAIDLLNQRVAEALAAYETNHAAGLVVESQSQNGDDGDNGNGRGNGDENGRGNGNGNEGGHGNGNPNRNDKGAMPVARNSHKRTIRADAAFAMSWRELMRLMTEVYYPRNEIQKMETELWNLTVKGNDLSAYT
ncbi:hypothetical protein Tco_0884330 [Tanacetum coccineum]